MSYHFYKSKLQKSLVFIFFLHLSSGLALADLSIRAIDESAIPYMEFLSKEAFDQRFPGQIKSELADLEKGWYVIYIHKQLNYYFGPILLKSTGQDYLSQLEKTVEAAVEQRPVIKDFQLILSYEPSTATSENSGHSSRPNDGNGRSDGVENGEQPDEVQQPSGFWEVVRRIFGF